MGHAISELAGMMKYVIRHLNTLYDVIGNMLTDPEKFEELKEKLKDYKGNGYEYYS